MFQLPAALQHQRQRRAREPRALEPETLGDTGPWAFQAHTLPHCCHKASLDSQAATTPTNPRAPWSLRGTWRNSSSSPPEALPKKRGLGRWPAGGRKGEGGGGRGAKPPVLPASSQGPLTPILLLPHQCLRVKLLLLLRQGRSKDAGEGGGWEAAGGAHHKGAWKKRARGKDLTGAPLPAGCPGSLLSPTLCSMFVGRLQPRATGCPRAGATIRAGKSHFPHSLPQEFKRLFRLN